MRVEKLDDATVKFIFAAPNGLFLQYLASPSGLDLGVGYPRHYLEPFHEDYADPEALGERIRAEGFSDWAELFSAHAGFASFINDADKPTLHAWTLTKALGDSTTQLEAVRNPYYWKVDTAGNQLPYLDRVVYDVLGDREVIVLRGLNGDIDMQDQWIDVVQNKPLFFDNQEAGNYHFFETLPTRGNELAISFNLTHKDPVKREVFSDKNFRIGLSHAINRQEIIDLFYTSQGEPWQTAPRRESEFFRRRDGDAVYRVRPGASQRVPGQSHARERCGRVSARPGRQTLQLRVYDLNVYRHRHVGADQGVLGGSRRPKRTPGSSHGTSKLLSVLPTTSTRRPGAGAALRN